jgi:hypothetical protein
MDDPRVAPTVGLAACIGVVAALLAPYVLAESGSVGAYYGSGALNPLLAGGFALLGIIVFAAGREGRADPVLAAGVMLALGVFATLIAVVWALTVRIDAIQFVTYHRWVVAAVTALIPVSAGWFARALGVV